ncbi:YheU family protein [Gammaproteobacteria bacterium]|nr:YheU family protein [Gammaproteobacteria bacterium]
MKIPYKELTEETLINVVDAFILREGTDYGHREIAIEQKRERVLSMLSSGSAEIVFYPENEHVDIVLVDH